MIELDPILNCNQPICVAQNLLSNLRTTCRNFTANVCRDFQGLCGEIGVRACIPAIPVIFEVNQKKSVDFLYIHFIKIFQISL